MKGLTSCPNNGAMGTYSPNTLSRVSPTPGLQCEGDVRSHVFHDGVNNGGFRGPHSPVPIVLVHRIPLDLRSEARLVVVLGLLQDGL